MPNAYRNELLEAQHKAEIELGHRNENGPVEMILKDSLTSWVETDIICQSFRGILFSPNADVDPVAVNVFSAS